jgi:hypothetical protein
MLNYGVSSKLLGVGDGGHVVTQDIHRVAHVGKHPKLDDELAASEASIYFESIVD